jgi:hypothetical protein
MSKPPDSPSSLFAFCWARAGEMGQNVTDISIGQLTSGLMKGTTPPCEMTTSPRSLFNLLRVTVISKIFEFRPLRPTLRHSGLQVASDEGRYVASCYHERHYRPTREFPQPSTRGRPQDRLKDESDSDKAVICKGRTRSTSTNALRVVSTLEETVHTTDRELKSCLGRA